VHAKLQGNVQREMHIYICLSGLIFASNIAWHGHLLYHASTPSIINQCFIKPAQT